MHYDETNGGVRVGGYVDFDIAQTLTCGQVFRFARTVRSFTPAAKDKAVHISEEDGSLFFHPCTVQEFEHFWLNYFDLNRDYRSIKEALAENDSIMAQAISAGGGIRILNQDAAETLFSFIISQRMHIKRIGKVINNLCEAHGGTIDGIDGLRSFPSTCDLFNLSEYDFIKAGAGYRASYLTDAAAAIAKNRIDLSPPPDKPADEIRRELLSIHGVGDKVADCVLLFGFGKRGKFPVDVWVSRAVSEFYFSGKQLSYRDTGQWAAEKFGAYAGYAQQYLFYYIRNRRNH